MARKSNGESVFSRVVRILEAFGPQASVLSVSELARQTGLSMPTVSRLVSELVDQGWLVRDADRGVRVGMRMWELATRASSTVDLCKEALPYAAELLADIGHHVQISVRQGQDLLIVERMSAPGAIRLCDRFADRRPLHASAPGLVLLAHESVAIQEAVLTGHLRRYTPHTVTDSKALRAMLSEIRSSGYALCPGFLDPMVTAIAVPLQPLGEHVQAALSVIVPNNSAARTAMTAVQATGARICRAYADRSGAILGSADMASARLPIGEILSVGSA